MHACQRNKQFMRKLEHNDFPEKKIELNLSPKEVGKVPLKKIRKLPGDFCIHVFCDGKLLKKESSYMSPFS